MDEHALAELLDREAIFELVKLERHWRDQGDWEKLAAAYVEDSWIRTTWFEGNGRDFAEASRVMAERGRHSKHPISPIWARVNGDRGLVESNAEIQNRGVIEGIEIDTVQFCRFFSRVRRTDAGWRLVSFEGIYTKDTITATNPADSLPLDWDALRELRPSYRVWAYLMMLRGYEVSQEKIGDDRPDLLSEFYANADHWLETGENRDLGVSLTP
ncbi:MAG TPA: nuclear transport factor 2 family protein [Solirubrobacteraceae bacterium]|nr:nuclear transport factor 2 family protein [Solirubrobacteraceae bacterium]